MGREIPRPGTHGSDQEGEAGRLALFPALLDRSRRDRDAHGEGRARPRKIDCMPDLRSCPSPCIIPAPLNVVLLKAQAVDAHVRADFPHGDADAVHKNLSRIPVGEREIAVGNHARQLVTVRRDGHGLAILLGERRGCGRDDEHRSNEACCSQTRDLSCTVAEHFRSPFMRSLEIRSGDVAIYDTRCSRISFTVFVISVAGAGFDEVASLVVESFAMTRRTSETWLLATHWVLARASVFFEIPSLGGNAS